MSKLDVFLWVTVKMSRRNILLVTKLAQGRTCNTTLTLMHIFFCIIFTFFFNFHELLLSIFIIFTNTAAGRYFKKTTIINISKYFCSFIISAGNYLLFVEHLYSIFGVFFSFLGSGGRGFYHFQELNTSADF